MGSCCEGQSQIDENIPGRKNNEMFTSLVDANKVKHVGKYALSRCIGKGTFGTVFKGYAEDNPGEPLAIKTIARSLIQSSYLKQLFYNEVGLMKKIQHDNIIHLEDLLETKENYYVIMKFCTRGSLSDYLAKQPAKRLEEKEAIFLLKQIMNGFRELRKNEVMHRDFKPDNVFLTENNLLVIGDLGFAKIVRDKNKHSILGTPLTMAPEVLMKDEYGSKADLYSIGVVFYYMLFGKYPFNGSNIQEILAGIRQGIKFPENPMISSNCKNLLRQLIVENPDNRIDWNKFFEHPLFATTNTMHMSVIAPEVERRFKQNIVEKDNVKKFIEPDKDNLNLQQFNKAVEVDKVDDFFSINEQFIHYTQVVKFITDTRNFIKHFVDQLEKVKNIIFLLIILLQRFEIKAIAHYMMMLPKNSSITENFKKNLIQLISKKESDLKLFEKTKENYNLTQDDLKYVQAATISLQEKGGLRESEVGTKIISILNKIQIEADKYTINPESERCFKTLCYNIILKVNYCLRPDDSFPLNPGGFPFDWARFEGSSYISDFNKLVNLINRTKGKK